MFVRQSRAVASPLPWRLNSLKLNLQAKKAETDLAEFVRLMWPIVEPEREFVYGWHIGVICDHLQAVTSGEIRRLLINVPPGSSKSLLTDVFYPAWEWGPANMPSLRYMSASYNEGIPLRDNLRCRRVIESDIYAEMWGNRFALTSDQNTKHKFENDRTGWKLATSVEGIGTGERGDRFIIDDPHEVRKAESETKRRSTLMWFREVVPTRMNDPEKSAIVVIMQRVHEDDVSGNILSEHLGYEHVMIPMRFDSRRISVTCLGPVDRRSVDEDGELLSKEELAAREGMLMDPERFPDSVVDELSTTLGTYAAAAQLQQLPVPRGGGLFKMDWWQLYGPARPAPGDNLTVAERKALEAAASFPPMDFILASADTALTSKEENDWSACTVWGVWKDFTDGMQKLMLMYAWQEHLEFPDLIRKLATTCSKYRVDRLVIEAKANGLSVVQEMRRAFRGSTWSTMAINPNQDGGGDKVARAHSVVNLFEDGIVFAPDRAWWELVANQCAMFPKGKNDDLVDSVVQAVRYMRKIGLAKLKSERYKDSQRATGYRQKPPPLYTGL